MNKVMVGTDAEFFVAKDGVIITSQEAGIEGTKNSPCVLEHGNIHRDNAVGEFNMLQADSASGFIANIHAVLDDVGEVLSSLQVEAVWTPSHVFHVDDLWHPEQMEFGCEGDFDAWGIDTSESPNPDTPLRTAGGHIHLGFDEDDEHPMSRIAQACDIFLGLPSVVMDKDTRRKALYGQSGKFRPKPYGLEYRVLSNFWLADDILMKWAFDNAIRSYESNALVSSLSSSDIMEIKRVINDHDEKGAMNLIAAYDLEVCHA